MIIRTLDLIVYEFLKNVVYQYELGPVEQRRVFESFGKCLPTFRELTEFFLLLLRSGCFLDWMSVQFIELYFLLIKYMLNVEEVVLFKAFNCWAVKECHNFCFYVTAQPSKGGTRTKINYLQILIKPLK